MKNQETTPPAHVPSQRVVHFDFRNDERIQHDLHEGLVKLRNEAPSLFWTPANGGHWVALDPELISTILRTPSLFSNSQLHIPKRDNPARMIPESLDPPEHLVYRRLMMSFFEPRNIAHLQDRVDYWTTYFIENVRDNGKCEFVDEIASRIPVTVFMEFVGFPLERHEDFRKLVEGLLRSRNPEENIKHAQRIHAELQILIEARMEKPQEDLLSQLIQTEFEGRKLTFDELMSIGFMLFIAGLDTVTNAMTFAARHLAVDQAFQNSLRNDTDRCNEAANELLRRYTFANLPRMVMADNELDGIQLKKGEMILCVLATVGLDERKNPNAMAVTLDRDKRNHFAFGHGGHTCLGRHLALMELTAFLKTWLAEIGPFSVDESMPSGVVRGGTVASISSLHLCWPLS